MIARRSKPSRRRLIHSTWRDAAASAVLFIVMFIMGLAISAAVSGGSPL